jgi:anti-sigma regulatory factor (Ser/Thr protein kinase)
VLHRDRLEYTPLPGSVRLARQRAARLVGEWGCPQLADDAAVLLSELATNAMLHACAPRHAFGVELALTGKTLRMTVTDPRVDAVPQARSATSDEQFGRGMLIVGTLAARWGIERNGKRKAVWCELDV